MTYLNVGAHAPEFTVKNQAGVEVSLAEQRGRTVILYFYPKDDTPGCTIEGIEFTEQRADLEALGAVIFGVSADSVESHEKFCHKHDIEITLLSDPDRSKLIEPYGVWIEKNMYGKKSMGIGRTTYVINGEGVITHVFKNVKAEGHAASVLQLLQAAA